MRLASILRTGARSRCRWPGSRACCTALPGSEATGVSFGRGEVIHWPDLDEDISVENLLAGSPSGESQRSFKRWLERRWL